MQEHREEKVEMKAVEEKKMDKNKSKKPTKEVRRVTKWE